MIKKGKERRTWNKKGNPKNKRKKEGRNKKRKGRKKGQIDLIQNLIQKGQSKIKFDVIQNSIAFSLKRNINRKKKETKEEESLIE